ncbi:MAG: efflux RND transporter permease subunit [Myxococcales bacterium]|nr:efflux RND transporter permease subunit [Myxococcales bacterium]
MTRDPGGTRLALALALALTSGCTQRERPEARAEADPPRSGAPAEPSATPREDAVIVRARAEGYGPVEVESMITRPLEEALANLPGLEGMTSESREGEALVRLTLARGEEPQRALLAARERLEEALTTLPEDVERPTLALEGRAGPPDWLLALRPAPDETLSALRDAVARELLEPLQRLPGGPRVELCGGEDEVRITLDPAALTARGLTLATTIAALDSELNPLRARGELSGVVPTTPRPAGLEELAATALDARGGAGVQLRDVASIERAPARAGCQLRTANGAAVGVLVWRAAAADDARALEQAIDEALTRLTARERTVTRIARAASLRFELHVPATRPRDLEWLAATTLPRALEPLGSPSWALRGAGVEAEPFTLTVALVGRGAADDATLQTIERALLELPNVEPRLETVRGEPPPRRVAVVLGPELEELHALAHKLAEEAGPRWPRGTVAVRTAANKPELAVQIDRARIAQHGLSALEVRDALALAGGSRRVGALADATPVLVSLPDVGEDPDALLDISIPTAGSAIPLRALVSVERRLAARSVTREDRRRGVLVEFTGEDVNAANFAKLQRELAAALELPAGYTISWR